MEIITGYTGENHVTSADDASLYRGILGQDDYVLEVGNKFAATIVNNNTVRIMDGDLIIQGHQARIRANDYNEVTIDNGTPGQKRNDLIVARYQKNTITGIESISLEVVKGTPGTTATDPEIIQEDLKVGGTQRDFPLYRVSIDGINLQSVTSLFNVIPNLAAFKSHLADYASLFTDNADAKNSIYRGKYLGNTVTAEQYTAISSGTFTDLYIGDYWTIGGVNWRIAAFNYYRNTGDSLVPGNHITIVPDTQLYTHVMNDTDTTTGGYIGSKMYTEGLEQAKTIIRGIFGTHLVKHRQILSNATVDGKASGWVWLDSEVELMNEIMVYGASVFGASNLGGGSGHNIGVGKSQLPLFRLNPRMINIRQSYWLRDVVSASRFAFVYSGGNAGSTGASDAPGVRPAFSIS
ncbi:MAG: hypothetical protein WAO42_12390 [Caldicoprobacterales bacterium]